MRRRTPRKLAAIVVGAAVAAVAAGSAAAALYRTQVVDTHSHNDTVTFEAYAFTAGWVNVLFQGDIDDSGTQTWEVIIRDHTNQVVYDGPCVATSNSQPSFVTLATNFRQKGARLHHYTIRECSGNSNQAIEQVVLQHTQRNMTIRNVNIFS
jgi:hypothetical protein